jgi:hypothetical protein
MSVHECKLRLDRLNLLRHWEVYHKQVDCFDSIMCLLIPDVP